MALSMPTSDMVKSSDAYEEDLCQPCSFGGKIVSSECFCIDCEEYLCKRCSEYHKIQKVMRNHQLVSRKEAKKSPHAMVKDKCSVKCTVHKYKTVKYFCKTHNVLGCSVCITMKHTQCSGNVDYIPTVAADIKHNDDFQKFNENLKAIEAACKAGISDVKKNLKVTETDHGQLKEAMQQFREQVIGALDKLENNIMAEAGSIMREEKKKLDDLSKKLVKHQAEVDAMIKQADALLSSGKHCDTYLYMQKEAKQLISLDKELKRMTRGQTLQRYKFQPNMDILKTIASGKLSCRNGNTYFNLIL